MTQTIVMIAIIYLMILLLKRWKKMAEHETLVSILSIIGTWLLVFFGVPQTEAIPQDWKLPIVVLCGLVSIIGIGYILWKYKQDKKLPNVKVVKLKPSQQLEGNKDYILLKKSMLFFWTRIILGIINVCVCFYFAIALFVVFSVNGIPVVTFYNVASWGYAAIGFIYTYDIVRLLRKKRKKQ